MATRVPPEATAYPHREPGPVVRVDGDAAQGPLAEPRLRAGAVPRAAPDAAPAAFPVG